MRLPAASSQQMVARLRMPCDRRSLPPFGRRSLCGVGPFILLSTPGESLVPAAQLMDILDMAIVNVALPSISQELQLLSASVLQWVVSAHALAY